MIDQPICRCDRFPHDVRVVAVREYAGPAELGQQERLGPRFGLPMGGPGAVPIASQTVNKADVDRGVGAVVQNFDSVRKGGN
jgi:hypothetical protein